MLSTGWKTTIPGIPNAGYYDNAPEVRIRAAAYIADTHYLHFLPDIQAALHNEKDPQTRAELQKQVDKLKALLP